MPPVRNRASWRCLLFGARPRACPHAVPDLVAARLPRLGAVALDLTLGPGLREAGGRDEVIGRLFARPLLGMNAGIDDQTRRAKQEGLEIAGALQRIGIAMKLVAKLFGIKRPAFAI